MKQTAQLIESEIKDADLSLHVARWLKRKGHLCELYEVWENAYRAGCVSVEVLRELARHPSPGVRLLAAEHLLPEDPNYAGEVLMDLSRGVSCIGMSCRDCCMSMPMPTPPFSCRVTRRAEITLRNLRVA